MDKFSGVRQGPDIPFSSPIGIISLVFGVMVTIALSTACPEPVFSQISSRDNPQSAIVSVDDEAKVKKFLKAIEDSDSGFAY